MFENVVNFDCLEIEVDRYERGSELDRGKVGEENVQTNITRMTESHAVVSLP